MPIATRSYPQTLPATITQAALMAAIREALILSGFPQPIKQYISGTDLFCVWALVFDATKAAGTAFYRLKVTATLVVSHTVGSGFTDSTNTLLGALVDFHLVAFTANLPIEFAGFQSSELILCLCTQGSTLQFNAGYLRLENAVQWDDAGFCRIFLATTATFTNLNVPTPSPYGTTASFVTSLNASQMQDVDSTTNTRSTIDGIHIWSPSNMGVAAWSSLDLSMGANSGMAAKSLHTPQGTTREYYVSRPGAGTLLIRVK
jgi:hypothetical protein